jgi:hypothetical protein
MIGPMIRPLGIAAVCLLLAACAVTGPQVALPSAPAPGEPGNIAGLTTDQIKVAFGQPAFVRNDNGTQMWRYDGASCKAFFFFYPANNALTVKHVETVPRGAQIAADSNCLASLQVQKAVPSS